MEAKDVENKVLDAFVEAVKRFRWLIFTTIMLTSLLLIHAYLEHGFTDAQLQQVIVFRLVKQVEEHEKATKQALDNRLEIRRLQEQRKALLAQESNDDVANTIATYQDRIKILTPDAISEEAFDQTAANYAADKFANDRAQHMLDQSKLREYTLPLVPISVPENDFAPIIGMILVVFFGALWLTARSIDAPLTFLLKTGDPEIRRLLRLHLVFTGVKDVDERDAVSSFFLKAAIWTPFVLTLAIMTLDISQGYLDAQNGFYGTPRTMFARSAFLALVPLLQFAFCVLLHRDFNSILDKLYAVLPSSSSSPQPSLLVDIPQDSTVITMATPMTPDGQRQNGHGFETTSAVVTGGVTDAGSATNELPDK